MEPVDWEELQDAFGDASEVPGLLAAVSGARGEELQEAIGELYEHVLHQGTIYSASPPAVQALIGMAAGAGAPEKRVFYEVLSDFAESARQAIGDVHATLCNGGDPAAGPAILGHILQARAQFAPDLRHPDGAIRGLAAALLTASADAGFEAAKLVRDGYLPEPDPGVRRRLLEGLTRVRGRFADWRQFLSAALGSERDSACRFALLSAQVLEMGPGSEPAAVNELAGIFPQAGASDSPPPPEAFFDAVHLLGRERELAALMLALDGAAHPHPARLLAERLLRLVFDDRRTGWGETTFSFVDEGKPLPVPSTRRARIGLFKLKCQTILWKRFPFLMRLELRRIKRSNRNRIQQLDYRGLEGAAPEIPARLTGEQRSVLGAFAEEAVLWEFRTNLWELFGLPASADEMRRLVTGRA